MCNLIVIAVYYFSPLFQASKVEKEVVKLRGRAEFRPAPTTRSPEPDPKTAHLVETLKNDLSKAKQVGTESGNTAP